MAEQLGELFVKIDADTKGLKTGLAGAEKQVGGFAGAIKKHHKAIGVAMTAVGGSILAVGALAIKGAVDLNKMYSSIAAGTGTSGEELEKLKRTFKKVAGSVSTDTEAIASVITELNTRLDMTGEPLENMAIKLAEVSRMLDVDVTQATVKVTQAMNRWQVSAEAAPAFLDKLFVASQKTGIGIDQLSGLMAEYGSILINVGYSQEEAIALFSSLHKAGLPITRIMPALNMATRKFAEAGLDLKEGLTGAIAEIKNAATQSKALAIATGIFGAEGAQRLTDAVRAGDLELDSFIETLTGATGAVDKFSTATKDPATRMAELKNKLKLTIATIGETFIPVLENLIRAVTPIIEKIRLWVEENPELTKKIVLVVGAIGGLLVVLGPMMIMLPGIIAAVSGLGVVLTILTGPIGLAIAAIVGLIAIGILVWKNWDKIIAFFSGIPATLKSVFGTLADIMMAPFRTAAKAIGDIVNWIINQINKVSVSVPSWVPGIGGRSFGFNIPKITMPSFEYGGIVPGPIGQPVTVEAHGGERFAGRGGFGTTVNVYVQGSVISERELSDKLRELFIDVKGRNTSTGF